MKRRVKRNKEIKYFTSPKIEVRTSGSKGLGVFTKDSIKKGEIIEIAPIINIPPFDAEIVQATELANYTFSYSGDEDQKSGSAIALGYASLYNHSNKNNVDYWVLNRSVVMEAARNIKAGEELCIDYNWGDEYLKDFK